MAIVYFVAILVLSFEGHFSDTVLERQQENIFNDFGRSFIIEVVEEKLLQ